MNRSLKNTLIFLSGVGTGAVTAILALKSHYNKIADKEVEEIHGYYEKKLDELKMIQDEINLTKDIDESEEKVVEDISEEDELAEYEYMVDKLKYNRVSSKGKKSKKKEEKVVEEPPINVNEPKIISYNEYSNDLKYEKVIVSYFEEDGVLMLDDESIFEDGLNALGSLNLEQFGMTEDDPEPDTIYIRNELLGTDYEVVREEGSYEQFLANG